MRYFYNLAPDVDPIIMDLPIYDATGLANGALLMLGTTDPDSGADQKISFVVAATGSSAEAVNAIGILNDSRYTSSSASGGAPSSVYATATNGAKYGKVIINPGAVYLAEYDQSTAIAITSTSSTTVTVPSLEDDIDGGWLYFVGTHTGVTGSLRFLTASASGSATMDSALNTTGVSSDTIIKIYPQSHRTTDLTTDATGLKTLAAIGSGVKLHVLENYINTKSNSFEPLRKASHKGLNNLVNAHFFAALTMRNHVLIS